MQPFNVYIGEGTACQLYTILPKKSCYAIMVNDAVIGAISEKAGEWIEVPLAEVDTSDLPLHSKASFQEDAVIPIPIEELGKEISLVLAGLPEPNQDGTCS